MNDRLVIDASMALALFLPSQTSEAAEKLLLALENGAQIRVPSLWFYEVGNALLVLERRRKLSREQRIEALKGLTALNVSIDDDSCRHAFSATSALALDHGLSVYDAAYLELALREQLPLATKDEPLRAAARKCGLRTG